MRQIFKKLLSVTLCLCVLLSILATSAFAAGETYQICYEFDQTSYRKGDTVTADLVLKRTDSTAAGFDLYAFSVQVGYMPLYLEFKSCTSTYGDFRITDPSNWNVNYDKVQVAYHGLGNKVACANHAVLATLTFTAKNEIASTSLKSFLPEVYTQPGVASSFTSPDGTISIGDDTLITYAVSFSGGTGATGTAPTIANTAAGNQFILPQNTFTRTGYTFAGWSDGTNTYQAGETYTMPAHAVTFTAQWTQDQYTISFTGGSGTTGAAPAAMQRAAGETISLPTAGTLAKAGYIFDGWSYNGKTYAVGASFTVPAGNVTFTAVWKADETTYTISFSGGSGTTGNAPADMKYAAGTKITIPSAGTLVRDGYTFVGWKYNGKTYGAGDTFTVPANNVVFTAVWKANDTPGPGPGPGPGPDDDDDDYLVCPRDYTCPIEPFIDTANNYWWHDGVHFCVENGYMVGVSTDKFNPNGTLSRAMIVTILWRMEGSPVVNYAMSFKDVANGQWYTEAIRWAQSTGVVTGYNADSFGPNNNVTREQLAAILYRYADFKGMDVSERANLSKFSDASSISGWALENMKWANAVGIINGRTTTTIVPTGTATRAEAANMVQRFCEKVLSK